MQFFRELWRKALPVLRSVYLLEQAGQQKINPLAVILSLVVVAGVAGFFYFGALALYPAAAPQPTAGGQIYVPIAAGSGSEKTAYPVGTQPGGQGSESTPVDPGAATTPSAYPVMNTTSQHSATSEAAITSTPTTASQGSESPSVTPQPGGVTPTNTQPAQAAATVTPTQTSPSSTTATVTLTPAITGTSQPVTMLRVIDGMRMIRIPAGPFMMGTDELDEFEVWYGEMPKHEVNLDAYFIDETEVTNAMYAKCVTPGFCTAPELNTSASGKSYYNDPAFANYPVIYVNWDQANAYCTWAGGRLPSEAEWEKAARGTDERLFPWGNTISCDQANYLANIETAQSCEGDTVQVGRYPAGKSPYGLLDMAGNVAEWVNDWMDDVYYSNAPRNNPRGPASGAFRVLRGGAWSTEAIDLRTTARGVLSPQFADAQTGFRCALNP